jgi:excisionase family DNA binding protein
MPLSPSDLPDDGLLKPHEVARLLGVSVTQLGAWARDGKLPAAVKTPGGHRRFRWADVRDAVARQAVHDPEREQLEIDAARLYDQGWSIRQVAEKFDCSYGAMRRILLKRTILRPRAPRPQI